MQSKLVSKDFQYSIGEEIANSILHGIGAMLAVAGLVLLTLKGAGYLSDSGGNSLMVFSYIVFTVGMILTFLASTLYHAIQQVDAKRIFRILDHGAVYLLIAGTYTPISLLALGGAAGWVLFGIEWGLAVTGITLYSMNVKFIKKIEIGLYAIMGWAVAVYAPRLASSISTLSLVLIFAGGLAYTLGIFWYARKKHRGSHAIWHIFVLLGAIGHWLAIWFM
ncbi:MAG: hemolysin III family protein [Treponema sp.]|jgi:hemolysin III|nr:hemolysin III family protein [Treponema sp.]